MILVIDNYDSFTYNLVQYLGELGAEVVVKRNDVVSVDEIRALGPTGVLISPGPGRPEEAGVSLELIAKLGAELPIFGVCLGHQSIAQHFGASIVRAERLMHGRTSEILHEGRGVFEGLPSPLTATRYHSLIVKRDTIPEVLEVTAWTDQDEVMGVRHRELSIEGVQFHPESFLTEHGHELIRNWLSSLAAGRAS
ncbi:MAG: aminodeoxychorismate/anthranilate synthase component II [Deltaproteobacteria bacterium]|nr:MAG: aminodeoxychorismate/anthranilate synthase component II [Deltaproteobacteria bacterium]